MDSFVRGLAIGVAVAAPVGPIGILCIRRTLSEGTVRGLCCGLGAALADALYAFVAATALSLASAWAARFAAPLHLGGGIALTVIGVQIARQGAAADVPAARNTGSVWTAFLSTLGLTLVNPATILSFAGIITGVFRAATLTFAAACLFALGVLIGSALWWVVLCVAIGKIRLRLTPPIMRSIRYAAAAALIAFGVRAIST